MYKKKWLAQHFPENPHADLRSTVSNDIFLVGGKILLLLIFRA